jgi:hypothetical protein
MTTNASPELSIVLVTLDGESNVSRFLTALQGQECCPPMEVLVTHDARLDPASLTARFPGVRFFRSAQQGNFAVMRAAGAREARGTIVAFTEDQCIPPPRWCANIVAAHRARSNTAIGGTVDKQGSDTAINWAIFLRELGVGYMPPVEEGPSAQLTDCNVTYKRSSLEAIRHVWQEAFHEPKVHAALAERGDQLWLSPALLTMQQRSFTLRGALQERYDFGRLYGSMRVAGVPLLRRLVMIVASIVLPALLVTRVVLATLRKQRHRGQCLRSLPYLSLFAGVWSWGEFLGYVTAKPPASWRAH